MRPTSKLLALALTVAMQAAVAAPATVELKFEDISIASDPLHLGMVKLGDRYKGDGVQFTDGAWGVTTVGCKGIVSFVPYGGGCSGLLLAGDPRDTTVGGDVTFTLNFAEGFIKGSSLVYSALTGSGVSVTLFSELDGKGDATRVTGLVPADCNDGSGASFCVWKELLLEAGGATGIARSMVISGFDESLMLDNLKLVKATTAPGTLPEPASAALVLGALGAAGWSRKRKSA
ncbi:MAG: PEP-CTERM sorting domain-containing protein [Burkholderiales bacterium]|nr:PEP-CTERM sorting domain-containing protein [Burkholderiales bacterium]